MFHEAQNCTGLCLWDVQCSTVHPLDIVYQYGALPYDFCGLVQNIKDLGMYV